MGLEPFVQIGVMAPRNSKMRFYSDIRIAQNVLAVMSGSSDYDSYYDDTIPPSRKKDWPTEFGIEFGLAF